MRERGNDEDDGEQADDPDYDNHTASFRCGRGRDTTPPGLSDVQLLRNPPVVVLVDKQPPTAAIVVDKLRPVDCRHVLLHRCFRSGRQLRGCLLAAEAVLPSAVRADRLRRVELIAAGGTRKLLRHRSAFAFDNENPHLCTSRLLSASDVTVAVRILVLRMADRVSLSVHVPCTNSRTTRAAHDLTITEGLSRRTCRIVILPRVAPRLALDVRVVVGPSSSHRLPPAEYLRYL